MGTLPVMCILIGIIFTIFVLAPFISTTVDNLPRRGYLSHVVDGSFMVVLSILSFGIFYMAGKIILYLV